MDFLCLNLQCWFCCIQVIRNDSIVLFAFLCTILGNNKSFQYYIKACYWILENWKVSNLLFRQMICLYFCIVSNSHRNLINFKGIAHNPFEINASTIRCHISHLKNVNFFEDNFTEKNVGIIFKSIYNRDFYNASDFINFIDNVSS